MGFIENAEMLQMDTLLFTLSNHIDSVGQIRLSMHQHLTSSAQILSRGPFIKKPTNAVLSSSLVYSRALSPYLPKSDNLCWIANNDSVNYNDDDKTIEYASDSEDDCDPQLSMAMMKTSRMRTKAKLCLELLSYVSVIG